MDIRDYWMNEKRRASPLLAEDCLLAQSIEGLLWRKPTLKLGEAAAIYYPRQSPRGETPGATWLPTSRLSQNGTRCYVLPASLESIYTLEASRDLLRQVSGCSDILLNMLKLNFRYLLVSRPSASRIEFFSDLPDHEMDMSYSSNLSNSRSQHRFLPQV